MCLSPHSWAEEWIPYWAPLGPTTRTRTAYPPGPSRHLQGTLPQRRHCSGEGRHRMDVNASKTMLCCWGHSCQGQTVTVAAVKDSKNRKGPKGSSVTLGPRHLGHARSTRNCQGTIRSPETAHSISPGSWPKQGSPGHISCLLRNTCWAKRSQLSSSVLFGKNLSRDPLLDQLCNYLTEYSAKQKQKCQTKWQLTALQEAVVTREHQHTNGALARNEVRAGLCELSMT